MVKKFILILIAVIIAVVIVLWFAKTPFISGVLSRKMHTKVSMSWVSIWPSHTKIKNFRIKNPPNSKSKDAVECKKIEIDYSLSKLFHDPSTIERIEIDDVVLNIEFYNALGTENNWTEIATNIGKNKTREKEDDEVIIKKLVVNNFVTEIRTMGLIFKPKIVRKIDHMEFENISSKRGFPTEQLIAKIFRGANLNMFLKDFLNPENFWEDLWSPFKNLHIDDEFVPLEQDEGIQNL